MCHAFLGVRAEIQAASLSCVRHKALYKPNNMTVTKWNNFGVHFCAFDHTCKLNLSEWFRSTAYSYVIHLRRHTGGKFKGTKKKVNTKVLAALIPGFPFFSSLRKGKKLNYIYEDFKNIGFFFLYIMPTLFCGLGCLVLHKIWLRRLI